MKKLILVISGVITIFGSLLAAGESAAVKKDLQAALLCGAKLDFNAFKNCCTTDYVKIAVNGKVMTRRVLEDTAKLLERLASPDCKFSEVAELSARINNIPMPAEQLARLRKLDHSEQSGQQLAKFRQAIGSLKDTLGAMTADLLEIVANTPFYVSGDTAITVYRSELSGQKYFGTILMKKENGKWKISREMSVSDSGNDGSKATEAEVRTWAKEIFTASCNTVKATDDLKSYAHDIVTVLPDGKTFNYHQAEKILKFKELLYRNSEASMVELMPLLIEGYGGTVNSEMVKHYAGLDKSGQGREHIAQMRDKLKKYDEQLKKLQGKFQIKHIFIYGDIVAVVENYQLPADRNIESVVLLKKEQGKYLIYRSVARIIEKNR